MRTTQLWTLAAMSAICTGLTSCSRGDDGRQDSNMAQTTGANPAQTDEEKANLANFDDLDFRVYSGQKWDEFPKSHAQDIVVHYPDGTTTTGLPDHLEKLKPQFVFAPDTTIKEHPIKIAEGNYTAVTGIMEGTFSRPMDLGGGHVIQPTGKKFRLPMATVGRWENGVMKEEWLYWDNAAFMKQIGIGQ